MRRDNPRTVVAALFLLLALGGCATEAGFTRAMENYLGRREADLVANLGPPDSVYVADGRRLLTWNRQRFIEGTAPTYTATPTIGGGYTVTPIGGMPAMNLRCRVTFTFEDGIATHYAWQGNHCVA